MIPQKNLRPKQEPTTGTIIMIPTGEVKPFGKEWFSSIM
jgi:hypothetical protein